MRHEFGTPILTAEQTRAMDTAVEKDYGLPLAVLMENAGRAVAECAMVHGPRRVLVAVGPGNNGGDALVAARILLERGLEVLAVLAKPLGSMTGLAALSARRFVDAGGAVFLPGDLDWSAWRQADLIIDGLLGTGLNGPVHEPVSGIIESITVSGVPVLSIDVPSGVMSDRSEMPETAIRARETVALGCWKPALVHYPAAELAGKVLLADIGIPPNLYPDPDVMALGSAFVKRALPEWTGETHKGMRGTLAVVAGSRGMTGAAVMACRSAVRAGAGLVYLCCPESLISVFEARLTEPIMRPAPDGGSARFTPDSLDAVFETLASADAVVIGPGIGHEDPTADFLEALLPRIQTPLLIDADGLNIVASRGLKPPSHTVLTPHPGEMSRLLGRAVPDIQNDRVASARKAAERFGCVVVLKGAHSVVTEPGKPALVNLQSHSVLATAGSGDVLSGIIGALLCQRVPPFAAAAAGVRWHGTMGVIAASKRGEMLGATDVIDFIPDAREEMLCCYEDEILV